MPDQIDYLYTIFLEHPVISTDSRKIEPGCLFFALRGESFNGNQFVAKAMAEGASFAIVDDPSAQINERCILVENVLTSLQNLARHHRRQFSIPLIAITGTNGKTTTRELCNAVLSEKYITLSTLGNLNNHIGVPLTLLRLRPDTQIAVIEMGANHPGEIDFLCNIALPAYGLITNVGKAHLEGFGSFEGVIRTKTELYRFLKSRGGQVFVNQDDPFLMEHATDLEKITYGLTSGELSAQSLFSDTYLKLDLVFKDQLQVTVNSHLYGKYNADNMMAAACIGQHFGVEPEKIREAVENYRPVNHRSQIMQTSANLLILDAYNANPSSMRQAIENFAESSSPNKTLVLGDMAELGEASFPEHEAILQLIDEKGFSSVFLVGPIFTMLNTKRENTCFHDSEMARLWFDHHRLKDATILLKGSRKIGLEKIIETL